jgi:hypothetical protein
MSASSGLQEVIKRIQDWEPQVLRLEMVFGGTQKRACVRPFLGIWIKALIHQRISHQHTKEKIIIKEQRTKKSAMGIESDTKELAYTPIPALSEIS